jgi:DNA-directed RNA polymerase subunit RPC12/RpoP
MESVSLPCPYCGSSISVRFPCCGYLCMRCGKNYEEEDVIELGSNKMPKMS